MEFQEKLEQYAELAVKIGVNIQKGQYLLINTSTEALEFARMVVKKAYEAGAGRVHVQLTDSFMTRKFYENGAEEEFSQYPKWIVAQREELIEKKGALLWIDDEDPDLLSGIPVSRISANQKAAGSALVNYRKAVMNDDIAWSIIAVPSPKWAAKVFPNLPQTEQVSALWEAIFKTVRIGEGSAVEKWQEHIKHLDERALKLNEKKFAKLHYKAPGTDLTIELPQKHIWVSGSSKTPNGTIFIANMPTEEVFTLPSKYGVNGYVSNTKPLAYQGNIIDQFKLTFENGKIVKAEAEVGNELLQELVTADVNSCYLGEVALVPHESPISTSGILYYNTLFDENASNHLAIGEAYPTCYEGGRDLSESDFDSLGINKSITHEDFMIGSAHMDIDGILSDGTTVPIFRNGNWAF
ncbi:aminopeptidase [Ureibacillus manganicus]|uniref:Peptidase M29 n=1 Tax=Ureibacillus manganicus DSM 26584 TaxID=1384049 RepID=A0A0A3I2W6_9BACL|nr:aminopeptidase [Ureibacillus manganicus]KGR77013.1 peptidase M29 [Ureibacillus manganicus DSM 26584]